MTGTLPPIPKTADALLIASLRHANTVSDTLNQIDCALTKVLGEHADDSRYDEVFALLARRLLEDSAMHLFIGAGNLRIQLPDDIGNPDPC